MRIISEKEMQEFASLEGTLRKKGWSWDDREGAYNGETLFQLFDKNPQVIFDAKNILKFIEQSKNLFHWRTSQQVEYDRLVAETGYTEQQRNQIAGALAGQGFWPDNENEQLENWCTIVRELQRRGWTPDHTKLAIGNIHSVPGQRLIEKHRPKFDAQAAVEEQRKKRETFQRNPDELLPTVDAMGPRCQEV